MSQFDFGINLESIIQKLNHLINKRNNYGSKF